MSDFRARSIWYLQQCRRTATFRCSCEIHFLSGSASSCISPPSIPLDCTSRHQAGKYSSHSRLSSQIDRFWDRMGITKEWTQRRFLARISGEHVHRSGVRVILITIPLLLILTFPLKAISCPRAVVWAQVVRCVCHRFVEPGSDLC